MKKLYLFCNLFLFNFLLCDNNDLDAVPGNFTTLNASEQTTLSNINIAGNTNIVGNININNSVNSDTNINTGNSTGSINIGNEKSTINIEGEIVLGSLKSNNAFIWLEAGEGDISFCSAENKKININSGNLLSHTKIGSSYDYNTSVTINAGFINGVNINNQEYGITRIGNKKLMIPNNGWVVISGTNPGLMSYGTITGLKNLNISGSATINGGIFLTKNNFETILNSHGIITGFINVKTLTIENNSNDSISPKLIVNGVCNINENSSFPTNINSGESSGTVNIGNSSRGGPVSISSSNEQGITLTPGDKGKVEIVGDLHVSGKSTLNYINFEKVDLIANTLSSTVSATIGGDLNVTGNADIGGDLNVAGELIVENINRSENKKTKIGNKFGGKIVIKAGGEGSNIVINSGGSSGSTEVEGTTKNIILSSKLGPINFKNNPVKNSIIITSASNIEDLALLGETINLIGDTNINSLNNSGYTKIGNLKNNVNLIGEDIVLQAINTIKLNGLVEINYLNDEDQGDTFIGNIDKNIALIGKEIILTSKDNLNQLGPLYLGHNRILTTTNPNSDLSVNLLKILEELIIELKKININNQMTDSILEKNIIENKQLDPNELIFLILKCFTELIKKP